jgi:hypothetical protein
LVGEILGEHKGQGTRELSLDRMIPRTWSCSAMRILQATGTRMRQPPIVILQDRDMGTYLIMVYAPLFGDHNCKVKMHYLPYNQNIMDYPMHSGK